MASRNPSEPENDACFSPDSWPHEVIAPGLAARAAAAVGMGRRAFVAEVVGRVPAWARDVLGTVDPDVLADTAQEFCLQMTEKRPDLAYVPGRATRRAYLRAVLRYTHYRLIGRWPTASAGAADLDLVEADGGGPAAAAESADLSDTIARWAAGLPPAELAAVAEVLAGGPCRCPSRSAHQVRSCRGAKRLRERAVASGAAEALPTRRSRRPRARRPNVRVVRRRGQRFACQPPRSMPM